MQLTRKPQGVFETVHSAWYMRTNIDPSTVKVSERLAVLMVTLLPILACLEIELPIL